MINVLLIIPSENSMNYGIGTYIRQLTQGYTVSKKVHLHIINCNTKLFNEFSITDQQHITYYHIPPPNLQILDYDSDKITEKYAQSIIYLLSETLLSIPNKVLHVNYYKAFSIALPLSKYFTIPIVSVVHSAEWQFELDGSKNRLDTIWSNYKKDFLTDDEKRVLDKCLREKEMYELSDAVISVTNYMKLFLNKYYSIPNNKIYVIQNGIDFSIFNENNCSSKLELKRMLYIPEDEKVLIFSGRLSQQKGVSDLLRAFREVLKVWQNCRLLIVGNGTNDIFLNECTDIWTKVTFTGLVDSEKLTQLYQVADIGVIPSAYDHCPYTALEMMGYGIPTIASEIDGLNEIFIDNYNCISVPVITEGQGRSNVDHIKIKEAVLKLLEDKLLSKIIVRNAKKMLYEKHNLQSMIDSTINVYKEVLY